MNSLSTGKAQISIITAIGIVFALLLPWNGWLSVKAIDQGEKIASIETWQSIYGPRIDDLIVKMDWLIERNGANPAAVAQFYKVATTTNGY